jgi:cobyrinic acid a,c-diamide synthase
MDKAFSFYYPDSLDLLEAWGAELVPFSPLESPQLPDEAAGVYLGGGFPELYARELAENQGMLRSLRQKTSAGLPVYAECGGLMYLGQTIEDQEGASYSMAGVIPARSSLRNSRLTLGYRTIRARRSNSLVARGGRVRGHEFHLSTLTEGPPKAAAAYEVLDQPGRWEGFRIKNVLASYIHLHMGSKQGMASRLVGYCARWKAYRR